MNRSQLTLPTAPLLLIGVVALVAQAEAGTLLSAPTVAGIVTGVVVGIVALLAGRHPGVRARLGLEAGHTEGA